MKAIKKVCGDDFPVSLRYSVVSKTKGFREGALPDEEYEEVGRDMAESEKAAKYLEDAGYDMLNCDNGTYDISQFAGMEIIVATGSTARVLKSVKGHEKMTEACEYLTGTEVGETVAVIGGGLTGCEIAYELALQGKKPFIVEMVGDLIAQKGVCLANSSYLREWFALHDVPVYLETKLKEVQDGAVICTTKDGKDIALACDSVISSAGYIPTPLTKESSQIHLVGDCKQIGNLRSVVWRAYEVAMSL